MTTMRRIVVTWTGLTALPGVSVFYAPFGTDAGADLMTFFDSVKSLFPNLLTWTVPTSGDSITAETGALTGAWTGGTGGTKVGTSAGAWASGCGGFVNWGTSTIVGARRLKGRTFMAPLVTASYNTTGLLGAGTITTLQGAATVLAASGHIEIWHRPTSIGAGDGAIGLVTSAIVPTTVTSLRSRRI